MLLPVTLIEKGGFLLEAKTSIPTTSIAGGLFVLKRTTKKQTQNFAFAFAFEIKRKF